VAFSHDEMATYKCADSERMCREPEDIESDSDSEND
jgi:hypothetical protein